MYESFPLLRHVQIGRNLKLKLAYKILSVNFAIISLYYPFPLLRHVQIGRYLKVTLAYRDLKY